MRASDFALFGAPPAFAEPLPIGQRYFPTVGQFAHAFRDIFEREYYTEYGPLNRQLEQELQSFLGVRHAICVTNESIGFLITVEALGLTGKVILPRPTAATAGRVLSWAGLQPLYCDVDPETSQIDVEQIEKLLDDDVSGILGAHLWGGACNAKALANLARANNLELFFDASHSFGCAIDGTRVGSFGHAEVFSFHQDNIVNATEGGCVCTQDDDLAARLRTMRGSAGSGEPAKVSKTVNGRFSEAQAALAMLNLGDFPLNRAHNEALLHQYDGTLASVPGLDILMPKGVTQSNCQFAIGRLVEQDYGLSREMIVAILNAENVGARPLARTAPGRRATRSILDSCISLPIGALVTSDGVDRICSILSRAQSTAQEIRDTLRRTVA